MYETHYRTHHIWFQWLVHFVVWNSSANYMHKLYLVKCFTILCFNNIVLIELAECHTTCNIQITWYHTITKTNSKKRQHNIAYNMNLTVSFPIMIMMLTILYASCCFTGIHIIWQSHCGDIDGFGIISVTRSFSLDEKKASKWLVHNQYFSASTHFGLETPHGDMNPSRHCPKWWLLAWRHQAII